MQQGTAELEDWEYNEPQQLSDPYNCQSITNLIFQPRPPVMLPELLIRGSIGLMVSEPHVGKTLLTVDLAVALASRQAFFGISPPMAMRTVAFWLDNPVWDLRYHMEAIARGRNVPLEAIDQAIHYKGRAVGYRVDLNKMSHVENLITCCKFHNADLLVLDCFSACNSANDNDRSEMELVMNRCAKIAQEGEVAVLLTDHTPVAGRQNKESVYQAAGSRTKEAAADFVWYLRKRRDGGREMRVLKARGMKTGGRMFEYNYVDRASGGLVVEASAAQDITLMKRDRIEDWLKVNLDGVSAVHALAQQLAAEGLVQGEGAAESAIRGALTRMRKRGVAERTAKNVWVLASA